MADIEPKLGGALLDVGIKRLVGCFMVGAVANQGFEAEFLDPVEIASLYKAGHRIVVINLPDIQHHTFLRKKVHTLDGHHVGVEPTGVNRGGLQPA